MDKQSKLIFERYSRRTIIEQAPVNNIAPVSIGTPMRTWPQAGQQLQSDIKQGANQAVISLGKFFAENEFGILLNTIDLTPITNIVQLPYLTDSYNKQPNVMNATLLVLGGLSVLPYAGQGAEWFARATKLTSNPTVRQLSQLIPFRDKTFNSKNTKQVINTLRQAVFNNQLMETIINTLPANTRNTFIKARDQMVQQLNSPEVLQVLNATNKELQDAYYYSSKHTLIPKPNVFGGSPTLNSKFRRFGRVPSGEKLIKLEQIIRGLQNVQKVVISMDQLPTSIIRSLGRATSQINEVIESLPIIPAAKMRSSELFANIETLINALLKTFNQTDNLKFLPDDRLINFLEEIKRPLSKIDETSVTTIDKLKDIIVNTGKQGDEFLEAMDELIGNIVSTYNSKLSKFDDEIAKFGKEKLSIDIPSLSDFALPSSKALKDKSEKKPSLVGGFVRGLGGLIPKTVWIIIIALVGFHIYGKIGEILDYLASFIPSSEPPPVDPSEPEE